MSRAVFRSVSRQVGVLIAVLSAFGLGLWLAAPSAPAGGSGQAADSRASTWTCSMHPQIKLPEPGACPICGMDLIPLEAGGEEGPPTKVTLSARAKTLARIRTVEVTRGDTTVELKLLGRVEIDETKMRTITSWVGGRIDRLNVRATGARIGRGQVIATLYSPEVYAAHQDLISAKKQIEKLGRALPTTQSAAGAALESARERLRLLGLPEPEIAEMERETSPRKQLRIRSPYGGTIVERMVDEGQFVAPGTPLYRTAGLGELWVQLDAYEGDLARITKGQKVTLLMASLPGESFDGNVDFVDPVLNPATRTVRVRVVVKNDKGRLSPGTFAEAIIHAPEGKRVAAPLVIPRTAPLFTGVRSVVYVEVAGSDGLTYEPREVQLGPRAGEVYPVVSGLKERERVVVNGAFTLDSELQIRGGRSVMTMEDDGSRHAPSLLEVPSSFLKGLEPVLREYLALQKALAADDVEAARKAFDTLGQAATRFHPRAPKAASNAWHGLRERAIESAKRGGGAKDILAVRAEFLVLSQLTIEVMRRFGNPSPAEVRLAYCPMAADGKGAHWLQQSESIENPYFGKSMFKCGDIQHTVVHADRLASSVGPPPPAAPAGHAH